jgi:hypothetical protein
VGLFLSGTEPDGPKNLKRDGCHRGPLAGSGKIPGESNELEKIFVVPALYHWRGTGDDMGTQIKRSLCRPPIEGTP